MAPRQLRSALTSVLDDRNTPPGDYEQRSSLVQVLLGWGGFCAVRARSASWVYFVGILGTVLFVLKVAWIDDGPSGLGLDRAFLDAVSSVSHSHEVLSRVQLCPTCCINLGEPTDEMLRPIPESGFIGQSLVMALLIKSTRRCL